MLIFSDCAGSSHWNQREEGESWRYEQECRQLRHLHQGRRADNVHFPPPRFLLQVTPATVLQNSDTQHISVCVFFFYLQDYELQLASYSSGLETLLKIPIKRTMLLSPASVVRQEVWRLFGVKARQILHSMLCITQPFIDHTRVLCLISGIICFLYLLLSD